MACLGTLRNRGRGGARAGARLAAAVLRSGERAREGLSSSLLSVPRGNEHARAPAPARVRDRANAGSLRRNRLYVAVPALIHEHVAALLERRAHRRVER